MGLTVDGGINSDPTAISAATRPSDGRRAGGWMGRYVKRHLKAANRSSLDSFLLIHTHSGHIGDVTDSSPMSSGDKYKLTGPMDVDPIVPVDALIDRGYPSYDNPTARTAPFATNYSAYVKARVADGRRVERFRVGRDNQIRARDYVIATRKVDIRNFSQAWMHVTHPDLLQWLGDRTYPGHRDVFGTTVMPENLRENPWVTRHLRSIDDGQIVVRVAPDGGAFNIFVTGSQDQEDRVKLMPGPYSLSRKLQGA